MLNSLAAVNEGPPLILIVDDDRVMRVCLRQAMEQEGYRVIEADDGESCLSVFSEEHPDIVLLDAIMPVMDGFTCCTKIQSINGGNKTPVLMITGLEDEQSVDHAFSAGAVDYVTKPIHWAVLRQRVRRLIQQVRLYAQLEKANQELTRLATSDGLTQVSNRRHFDEYFHHEWQHMLREQLPLSLILCDIDFFKAFNDTYGHPMGDECLRQVAHTLQSAVKRSTDLAARYGGEEFAIVLPNTGLDGAEQVAQAIQAAVRRLELPHKSSKVSEIVTVSMGVTTAVPVQFIKPDMMVTAADRALYQAKADGRNCYRVFAMP